MRAGVERCGAIAKDASAPYAGWLQAASGCPQKATGAMRPPCGLMPDGAPGSPEDCGRAGRMFQCACFRSASGPGCAAK